MMGRERNKPKTKLGTLCAKNDGCSVLAWTFMAVSGTATQGFLHYVTGDRGNNMSCIFGKMLENYLFFNNPLCT